MKDRKLILHIDDFGLCSSTNEAVRIIIEQKRKVSVSTMVPCPKFSEAVDIYKKYPTMDIGIHLTINCEWPTYKWGPVSDPQQNSDLRLILNDSGDFKENPFENFNKLNHSAVIIECTKQIEIARANGLNISHIDTHMLSLNYPPFHHIYFDLARKYKVPIGVAKIPESEIEKMWLPKADAIEYYLDFLKAEKEGLIKLDGWSQSFLDRDPKTKFDELKDTLNNLPINGISSVIFHPAVETDELKINCSDWEGRVSDFKLLSSNEFYELISELGFELIQMRDL